MTVAQPQFLQPPIFALWRDRQSGDVILRCTACFAISICRPVANSGSGVRRCRVMNLSKPEKLRETAPEGEFEDGRTFQRCWIISRWITPSSFKNMAAPERSWRAPFDSLLVDPPSLYGDICRGLESVGLAGVKLVVIEKPIGTDLESSRVINGAVDAVPRIQHLSHRPLLRQKRPKPAGTAFCQWHF